MKHTPTVIIDTREKRPLNIMAFPTIREALPVGDYGIVGFSDWKQPDFIVERKSVDDLVASVTWERERFWKELQKMRQFKFAALLIEGTRELVENGGYKSKATPQSVLASLDALQVRNGIHVVWGAHAQGCGRIVEAWVRQWVQGIEYQNQILRRNDNND